MICDKVHHYIFTKLHNYLCNFVKYIVAYNISKTICARKNYNQNWNQHQKYIHIYNDKNIHFVVQYY